MNELQTRLFNAIKKGPITEVSNCISQGADVNYSKYTNTPLMEACGYNNFEAVFLLLQCPAVDINFGEPECTALLIALGTDEKGSHKKIVDLLFNDSRLSQEGTNHALLYYAKIGDLEKVKECLDSRHCDANYRHDIDGSALTNAAIRGHFIVINYLLSLPGIKVNDTNCFEEPPLTIAIRKSFLDIAYLFLDRPDIDLHVQSGLSGTPLTAALFYGLVEGWLQSPESERAKLAEKLYNLAERLLEKEARFVDREHPAALMCVIEGDSPYFLQLLLNKGADVNGKCGEEGYKETVDVEGAGGASPYGVRFTTFDLPIVAALRHNSCKVIPILLEAGADLDKKGDNGKSARELLADNTEPAESRKIIREWINAKKLKQKAPVGYGTLHSSTNAHSAAVNSASPTRGRSDAPTILTNVTVTHPNVSTRSPAQSPTPRH